MVHPPRADFLASRFPLCLFLPLDNKYFLSIYVRHSLGTADGMVKKTHPVCAFLELSRAYSLAFPCTVTPDKLVREIFISVGPRTEQAPCHGFSISAVAPSLAGVFVSSQFNTNMFGPAVPALVLPR